MSQLDLKIGPKIKAFRRQLGMQANKLAEELSISPSYLPLTCKDNSCISQIDKTSGVGDYFVNNNYEKTLI